MGRIQIPTIHKPNNSSTDVCKLLIINSKRVISLQHKKDFSIDTIVGIGFQICKKKKRTDKYLFSFVHEASASCIEKWGYLPGGLIY